MKVSGPAHLYSVRNGNAELLPLSAALSEVRCELVEAAAGSDVFAAHLEMFDDPMLQESIDGFIAEGKSEADAVDAATESICAMFADIDDEYLRARADDVRDICARIKRKITGSSVSEKLPDGCILVAEELLPSEFSALATEKIKGIICAKGSPTSHVCIMAHSKGIPIVTGVDISSISEGDIIECDDPVVGADIAAKVRSAGKPVYANAGSLDDIRKAMDAGADGIGLFRTEFLYLESEQSPSFEYQKSIYAEALRLCKGKPLIFRTMDIGGDKHLLWMQLPVEDNPFLGVRGIRLSLKYPELLKTQLEAIAAAAEEVDGCNAKVMFPMVCSAAEVARAKALIGEESPKIQFGAMVETPAAALDIRGLSAECDFFSIGTNDLTQYVMAADRGNAGVGNLLDAKSPAVKRLISIIINDAHACGRTVGICGELASDPSATDFLLDVGVDSLSVNRL